VPADKVALALKGTTTEYREVILSSLSSRVRKMIEQELNNGQAVPARDVIEARRAIIDLALEHAARGEIEIRNQEEELIT
jgi:flagellar motor switch protein FliG